MLSHDQKEFKKLLDANSRSHRGFDVFRDFCEMASIGFSNAVDLAQHESREARYFEIIKKYNKDELARFPKMMAHLTEGLTLKPEEFLGEIFMSNGFGNANSGQFFTPLPVCKMMAQIAIGDNIQNTIDKQGFATIHEPTCGAGAMIIAVCDVLRAQGINYQTQIHVTAQDLDLLAVHMTYLQLSLLYVPAVVVHGNSLVPGNTYSTWYTPAHVLDGWGFRLASSAPAPISTAPDPGAPCPAEIDFPTPPPVRLDAAVQLGLF